MPKKKSTKKEKMRTTSIYLPTDLLKEFKLTAKAQGTKVSTVLEQFVKQYVEKNRESTNAFKRKQALREMVDKWDRNDLKRLSEILKREVKSLQEKINNDEASLENSPNLAEKDKELLKKQISLSYGEIEETEYWIGIIEVYDETHKG